MKATFNAIVSPRGTFVVLCAIILWWAVQLCGPKIEGALAPVVVDTTLTSVVPAGSHQSRVWGTSMRVRDCEFRKIEWFFGTRDAYVPAAVKFEEASKVRPTGGFSFGPWLVDINPVLLEGSSFAIAYHECHPFYLTESLFYPNQMELRH